MNPMLYVFLHGLAILREVGQDVEIILPEVSGHVYKAGSWLAETPIEAKSLKLTNVLPGNRSIYGTGFLIEVPRQHPVTPAAGRKVTITVPRPREVLGMLLARDNSNVPPRHVATLNTQPTPTNFDSLAEVTILVYEQVDETQVCLDGHFWQPYSVQGSIGLHIISTSEDAEGEEHFVETERVLGQVITGYPGLTVDKDVPRLLPAQWFDWRHRNLGDVGPSRAVNGSQGRVLEQNGDLAFALAELEHPSSRVERLERLGRRLREGANIADVWKQPDPLLARSGICGPITI